jgi:putative radical SAM enzyme (TIGR03279 family)
MTEKSLKIVSLNDPASLGLDPDILVAGDRIIEVSGQPAGDPLDFYYITAIDSLIEDESDAPGLKLKVERLDGTVRDVRLTMADLQQLDVTFAPMDFRRCRCKCKFCFVDQMPPGLRETLYYKDEDFRLSFLYGNYTTLIDAAEADLERIVRQNLSPQYVSVHAVDGELREWIFGRPEKKDITQTLLTLAEAGITLHTQAVICPGINDGNQLDKTITTLQSLHPNIASLAVVPVGLTGHRQGLTELRTYRPEEMKAVIDQVEAYQQTFLAGGRQERFVYPSDEWYLGCGRDIPGYETYGEFPQIDNGVGMTRAFIDEIADDLDEFGLPGRLDDFQIVTGVLGEKIFRRYIFPLFELRGVQTDALPDILVVENRFFGRTVTCSGLLACDDIARTIKAHDPGKRTWLPPNVLNYEGKFLDGPSLEDLFELTGCRVEVPEQSVVQAWAEPETLGEENDV